MHNYYFIIKKNMNDYERCKKTRYLRNLPRWRDTAPENKIDLLIIPLCVIKTFTLSLFIRETKYRRNNLHFCFYIQMPTLL